MTFKIPEAKKENLEKLLEYLGNADLYSEFYDGNRAEDFKKCFDVDSEWCWKYAAIVLRGIEQRELGYAEMHHIVPKSFYGCSTADMRGRTGNMSVLSYAEHVYAHFCAYKCAIGNFIAPMRYAFVSMYDRKTSGVVDVTETEVISKIFSSEIVNVKLEIPAIKKLEEQGRHHVWEVSKTEYNREYRQANAEAVRASSRAHYERNRERICEQQRTYNESHREEQRAYSREYLANHREEHAAYMKKYYLDNKETLSIKKSLYRLEHLDELREKNKKWRADNHDAIILKDRERNKVRYAAKVAAGFRLRKDPTTGKNRWIFVGNPTAAEAA